MSDLEDPVDRLRAEWGLDFVRVRRVLAALAASEDVGDLVAASGLPRRDVESILADLPPDRSGLAAVAEGTTLQTAPDEATLTARMAELAAGLPPPRWRLDHVPATAETMTGRARYLASEYELAGASVLCLGDHDLTSLAVGSVCPDAELTVLDIDERILDHVADSAGGLGLALTAAWADLRLALPPSLVATADLVFTDPPYTTGGMRLFLMRGLEALRPTGHERLAFCFGTGARHLVKALEVQALLGELRLALEAMLPGFNRYDGAEAIGSRSDLYICRPTKGARVGEPSGRGRRSKRSKASAATAARIYTRGPAAEEASAQAVPEPVRTAALAAAGDGPVLLVGEGWVGEGRSSAASTAVALPEFFQRVAAWATAPRPGPFPFDGIPIINTAPDHGGAALRTLLVSSPERAVLIAPRRDVFDAELLAAAYDITNVSTGPGGGPAVVLAVRHDRTPTGTADAVLRHVLLHPGAKVINAWRDGLIAASPGGTRMTKNEARARITADELPPSLRRLRLWELPKTLLLRLPAEIARSCA